MKLLGSSKYKRTNDKNGKKIPLLDIIEVTFYFFVNESRFLLLLEDLSKQLMLKSPKK